MPKLTVKTESYRESLLESLRNPDEAVQYLNACLEDEDARVFLLALRDVAEAHGGIRALSRTAHLNRESLYRMLSKSGNPLPAGSADANSGPPPAEIMHNTAYKRFFSSVDSEP